LAPFAGDRDARYRGLETGAAHFAPEGDSFLSAVVNAPPVFFFPVPPLDAHGNRAERARPEKRRTLPATPVSFFSLFSLGVFFWGFDCGEN
jgi:hypothetical protein